MRGRKPLPLRIGPDDAPILQQIACSRSLPWYQSSGLASSWASPPGSRSNSWPSGRSATARPSGGPAAALRTRACPACWHDRNAPDGPPGFPPSSEPRSSSWPAWSRSPRGCTSPTGRARTWPVRLWKTESCRPSATGRFARSLTRWTSSRTAPGTGRQPGWTPSSSSGPRRSSGAMPTLSGCYARGIGWCASMRSPTARSWSGTRSGDPSPDRSSSGSSSTPGTERSTFWPS
jgi:hypothetical protein